MLGRPGSGESWRQSRAHGAPRGQPKKRTREKARLQRRRRRRAASASPPLPTPGMVEAALAAFAHEVRTPLTGILAISDLLATSDLDERERRWVDTIKAGAEHLASLATLFVDAARSGGPGLGVRQDFFDLRALARNAGDSLAGRAAAKGLQSSVEISEKLPGLRGRRSGPPARGAGKPDRQCGQVHRSRAASRCAVTPMREHEGQGRRRLRGLRQRHRAHARRDQAAVPAVLAGQCLASPRASAAPGSGCRRSSSWRARWAATSSWRSGAAAAPPSRSTRDADAAPRRRRRPRPGADARCVAGSARGAARSQRRGQSVRPRRAQRDPDRTRSSGGIHRPRRGRRRSGSRKAHFDAVLMDMVLPGINGIEAIRRIRALERAARAHRRSSACRAAATTRRRRAPPAPMPFWSSLCLRAR